MDLVIRDDKIVAFNDSGSEVKDMPIADRGVGYIPAETCAESQILTMTYTNPTRVDLLARYNLPTGSGAVESDHSQFETDGVLGCVAGHGDTILRNGNELRHYSTP